MAGRLDWKKIFSRDNLLIMVLSGVLLFIIALPTGSKKEAGAAGALSAVDASVGQKPQTVQENPDVSGRQEESSEAYVGELEEKLGRILSRLSGAGKVEVMITLRSSEELVVEKDKPISRSSTEEADAAGGSRSISEYSNQESTVYLQEAGESKPYVVKTIYPRIEGVVVVAEGAGNAAVSKELSDMVQVLFDLEAYEVKVVKMAVGNDVDK